ncbi:uncharacterized protein PV06_03336 [Exophiala oligosperma]|uniref:Uncharacterized protein n=2 Tax=Chaetothyriales TaxID=34395 RepID=A0A0D2EA80_9EURO|nr:uncharacterized protein PV06_03336 [Exophiala oligosperma]KAJ9642096.1 hypothetical protein H2204_002465 [Knufia peltigerae]KIW44899.1 hypothetical protein PV06_03336 [Exophiala oligosperma]
MKEIVLQGEPGKAVLEHDRPYPQPRSGYVLVDLKAVALNPTDWKHIDYLNEEQGTLSGFGDRIWGFAQGANKLQHEDGAFAERIAVKADIAVRVPDDMLLPSLSMFTK